MVSKIKAIEKGSIAAAGSFLISLGVALIKDAVEANGDLILPLLMIVVGLGCLGLYSYLLEKQAGAL